MRTRPQFKGIIIRIRIATPKKPNSARRPVCRVMLTHNKNNYCVAHIPGGKHTLRKHSVVLIFQILTVPSELALENINKF